MSVGTLRLIVLLYLLYRFLKWIFSDKNDDNLSQKKNSNLSPIKNNKSTLSESKKITYQTNTNTLKESILEKTNNTSSSSNKSKYLHVAGIPHRFGKSVKINTIFNEGQKLTAKRQKDNIHDVNAIKLYLGSQFVGFIPKDQNQEYALFMDRGGKLLIRVYRVDPSDMWRGVGIEITPLSP